jgi:hypothetical protein
MGSSNNEEYIDSAALRVEEMLDGIDRADLASAGPQLVENTAAVSVPPGVIIRYRSFASKLAHFFIDHDSYAADMLRAHLGLRAPHRDSDANLHDPAPKRFGNSRSPRRQGRTLADWTATCGSSASIASGRRTQRRESIGSFGEWWSPILPN